MAGFFANLKTYSLFDRPSKVGIDDFGRPLAPGASFADFFASLPRQLMGRDLGAFVEAVATARRAGRPVLLGMGAHVIKVGLNPVLIDLMAQGIVTGIAMNGACIVHDSELALAGKTSEDVGAVLGDGRFGAARETGEFVNRAIRQGAARGIGIGQALGEAMEAEELPHRDKSLLAAGMRYGVPVTVHVAMGADIVHIHPAADGAAIGQTSYADFERFCRAVAELEGGVYCNVGSAVLLPEVFLKALTAVRNLGYTVRRFTTANFDFIRHYRPLTNVVHRPTAEGGRGFHFTGHHELLLPLVALAVKERLHAAGWRRQGDG